MRSALIVGLLAAGLCGCSDGSSTAPTSAPAEKVKSGETKTGQPAVKGSSAMPKEPGR